MTNALGAKFEMKIGIFLRRHFCILLICFQSGNKNICQKMSHLKIAPDLTVSDVSKTQPISLILLYIALLSLNKSFKAIFQYPL